MQSSALILCKRRDCEAAIKIFKKMNFSGQKLLHKAGVAKAMAALSGTGANMDQAQRAIAANSLP
jgi:hypothetical protein